MKGQDVGKADLDRRFLCIDKEIIGPRNQMVFIFRYSILKVNHFMFIEMKLCTMIKMGNKYSYCCEPNLFLRKKDRMSFFNF